MDLEGKRVAIYARVSTEMQAEEEISIPGQIEECRRFAQGKGWPVVAVYKDAGFSGRNDERPDFQEMIAAAKASPKSFDIILTWRGNRLFRSVEHRLAYSRILKRRGVRMVAIHEPEFEGASAAFMETVLAAADELYAAQIAEDTLRGLKQIAKQGFSTGGRPPTGYRNVRKAVGLKVDGQPIYRTTWEPDPEIAPKVLKAFQMAAEGRTSEEICRATKIVSGKSSLSSLFRNRAYLGDRIYNATRRLDKKSIRAKNPEDQIVRVPHAHEAIIPQELFDKVQHILDTKRPRAGMQKPQSRNFLLSGLLWCKKHQVPYSGHSTGDRVYYACALRKKHGKRVADCPFAKKEALEKFVIDAIKQEIFTPERVRLMLKKLKEEQEANHREDEGERDRLKAELAQVEGELQNLYNAIRKGMSPEALAEPIEETRVKRAELQQKLVKLIQEREQNPGVVISDKMVSEVVEQARARLNQEDAVMVKAMLREYIDRMEIDSEELTINYTFADPRRKVANYWRPRGDLNP